MKTIDRKEQITKDLLNKNNGIQDIAKKYNISRQRVHQIYQEACNNGIVLPPRGEKPRKLKSSSLWLKRSRGKLGLTQAQLATKIGVATATVSDWENEGLPTKGTGAQTARRVIEEMFREKGGRDKQIEIGLDGQPYEVPQPQD
jgi:DNA-binding XRE family transcriptional regulator